MFLTPVHSTQLGTNFTTHLHDGPTWVRLSVCVQSGFCYGVYCYCSWSFLFAKLTVNAHRSCTSCFMFGCVVLPFYWKVELYHHHHTRLTEQNLTCWRSVLVFVSASIGVINNVRPSVVGYWGSVVVFVAAVGIHY